MMASVGGPLAPCFMVYPVPSIGDESLLQTIFHQKVARSIFAGYGARRLAIVELNDATLIAKVCDVLDKAAQTKAAAALEASVGGSAVTASALGLEDDTKKGRKTKRKESAALVEDWLDTLVPGASPDADAASGGDQLTLADLFAAPPAVTDSTESGPSKKAKDKVAFELPKGVLYDVTDSGKIDYITALHWRGHPLHVIVSPITVDAFYTCGGTVPTHAAAKKRDRGEFASDDGAVEGTTPRKSKRVEGRPSQQTAAAGDDAVTAKSPAAVFPKNCCQKCGSPDHFSRHCDGSGPGSSAQPVADTVAVAESSPAPAVNTTAAAAATPVFPKNCCQKCGSPDHFSRHCDGSGAASQAPAVVVPASTEATPAPRPSEARAQPPTRPAPTPASKAPTVARTSKDQCKFCGSADHLSRHCPSK